MRAVLFAVVVVLMGEATVAQQTKETKGESAATELDGLWHLVTEEKNAPPAVRGWDVRTEDALYILGDQRTAATRDGRFAANATPSTIRIDATKNPKTIDFKSGRNWWLAIYKIENDQLTIATQFSTEKRPDTFATKVDSGPGRAYYVQIYTKAKESVADAASKAAGSIDPQRQVLDGLWALNEVDVNRMGHGLDDPFRTLEAIYFENDSFGFARKDGWKGETPIAFKFDPTAAPPTLDMKFPQGTVRAIYKIVGDELTIASNRPSGERPLWFSVRLTAGTGRATEIRTFQRVHPTERIVQLTKTPQPVAAKLPLDGFWVVEYDKRNVPQLTRAVNFRMPEAISIENGKWLPATRKGTLLAKQQEFSFVNDSSAPVPTIDLNLGSKERIRGIYKLEDDTLYFATNLNDDDRPTCFTTNLTAGAGRARCVIVLRRGSNEASTSCTASASSSFPDDLISPVHRSVSPKAPHELNGYWILEKEVNNGPRSWKGQGEKAIYIEGNGYHFVQADGRMARDKPIVVHIDASTTPKTFNYKWDKDVWRGIYKLENGVLTIATKFSPTDAPASFSTKLDAGPARAVHVRTYTFVKETPENAQRKILPSLDRDKQTLDGLWILDEAETNSLRHIDEYPNRWEEAIYIEGNRWHSPDKKGNLKFAENPSALWSNSKSVPPTLDVNFGDKTWLGIYKIEDDRLTIAFGGPDVDRPRWFTTKLSAGPGRANFLRSYRRVPPSDDILKLKAKDKLNPATQKLDGVWIVEQRAQNGKHSHTFPIGEAVVLANGRWQSAKKDGTPTNDIHATYAVDLSAGVPRMNWKYRLEEYRVIYRIEGDTLYLATNFASDDQPCLFSTQLTAGPGRAAFVAILKRAPAKERGE